MFFFPVFLRTRVVVLLLSSNIYFTQKYWEYIVLYIQSMSFIVYTSSNNKTGIWLSNNQYTPIGLVGTFRNSAYVGLGGGWWWWLRTSKVYVSCMVQILSPIFSSSVFLLHQSFLIVIIIFFSKSALGE